MTFSIGYQLPDELESTYALCEDFANAVSDVYFAFGTEPSGRAALCTEAEREAAEAMQLEELRAIRRMGKTLTLLYNANCYGAEAASDSLRRRVIALTERLKKELDITRITTTSPFIAQTVKANFGNTIRVCSSVNMKIGSVSAMEQLTDFDGFYVSKECNRDVTNLHRLKGWCDAHGKTLHLLANSGCLPDCAFQIFHDNLIAHQSEAERIGQADMGYAAPCHRYLAAMEPQAAITKFLQGSFIPPEEIARYEPLFSEVKLATRMHSRPRMVLTAYTRGRFTGNLLDLTEPSYSGLLSGWILDNTRMPKTWADAAFNCSRQCESCTACADAVRAATWRI